MEVPQACSSRKYRRVAVAGAIGFGLVAAIAYGTLLLNLLARPRMFQIAWIAYLTVLFGAIAYYGLRRLILPRFAASSRRAKVLWVFGSLAGGLLITAAIPVTLPQLPSRGTLKIIATGEKNPVAKGSELWLPSIGLANGAAVPVSALKFSGVWDERSGVPVSCREQPARVAWEGEADRGLIMRFTAHPWSGVALVRWNGVEQRVDLYDPAGSVREVSLPPPNTQIPVTSCLGVGLYASYVLCASMLMLSAGIYFAARTIPAPVYPTSS